MRIKLLKPHRHAGKNYQAGDIIDTDLDTANYLANLKVAMPHIEEQKPLDTTVEVSPPIVSTVSKVIEALKPTIPNNIDSKGSSNVVKPFESKNPPTGIMPEIVKT